MKLIRTINMECPVCGRTHDVEERESVATAVIKGTEVKYNERYYYCCNADEEECEFTTGKMMNSNLQNARNEDRKMHGLLTSDEIIGIREKYALSQVDFAKLLGWGEATVARYETKAIQDEVYDNILRTVRDNPYAVYSFFKKNKDSFPAEKKTRLEETILDALKFGGREYLHRQVLESEYVEFQDPCDANGFAVLNIEKLESLISYMAGKVKYLFKVRLMKMLWYCDVISYKRTGKAMTGLVYCHEPMGALPVGHQEIVNLENVNVNTLIGDNPDMIMYEFLPSENADESKLSDGEKSIIDEVIKKFITYDSKKIIEYMHGETAYKETKDKEIIPFSLAKDIRPF